MASNPTSWESFDAEQIEEAQSWVDYVPDMMEALEAGYLDGVLSGFVSAFVARQREVGGTVKVSRPRPAQTPVAGAPMGRIPMPGTTPYSQAGPTLPEPGVDPTDSYAMTTVSNDSNWIVTRDGGFAKHQVMSAAQKCRSRGYYFMLRNSRKYANDKFFLVKFNRTRCVVEEMNTGRQISVPNGWVVDSLRDLTATIDTTNF